MLYRLSRRLCCLLGKSKGAKAAAWCDGDETEDGGEGEMLELEELAAEELRARRPRSESVLIERERRRGKCI
jgi:hypothetical protein